MTGPEHFAEAERLLAGAESQAARIGWEDDSGDLSAAQVHATLALAAATVLPALVADDRPLPYHTERAWRDAIGRRVTRCVPCGSLADADATVCEDCGADPVKTRVVAEL